MFRYYYYHILINIIIDFNFILNNIWLVNQTSSFQTEQLDFLAPQP
jgi:hypothetical protein